MNTLRTPLFLMANLGAEVSRFFNAIGKHDKESALLASERARKMVLQIEGFPQMESRKEEVEKIMMILDDCMKEEKNLKVSPHDLQNYFLPFATRFLKQAHQ